MIYDLAIIGGGPAGAAAAIYAARKRLKTVMVVRDWLGQSAVSDKIENWIGTIAIPGSELAKNLEAHAKTYGKDVIDFKENEACEKIEKTENGFLITTRKSTYEAKTVLIATGSSRRKLDIPGANEYENKGLAYCVTCDGPMYSGMDVAVIGGGNAAFDGVAQLLAYCRSVTLLNRSDKFKADPGTIDAVSNNPKARIVTNAIPKQILGDKFVTAVVYTKTDLGTDVTLPVSGVFVEIGSIPNTSFAKEIVKIDEYNHIVTDPKNQRTSIEGVWAAGDCTDCLFHQNNIAAGDAVKAIEDIYSYIQTHPSK